MMLYRIQWHLITAVIALLFLTQCTKVVGDHVNNAQPSATPYSMSADAYLAMAQRQSGAQKNSLLLMAAGRYIYEGRWQPGNSVLEMLGQLTPEQWDEAQILRAKIANLQGHPDSSLSLLSQVHNAKQLSPFFQEQYHLLLAQTYETKRQWLQAINQRIALDELLSTDARTMNMRMLWLDLMKQPSSELQTQALELHSGSILEGWLRLAMIPQLQGSDERSLLSRLQQWLDRYPHHPAARWFPHPVSQLSSVLYEPFKRIALLLPLQGALSGPSEAIRDGFMAAEAASTGIHAEVRVYDTSAKNPAQVYQQAIQDNADVVVGPLSKEEVAAVMRVGHPIPTLFLNDMGASRDSNTFQLSLSPSYEASEVAVQAHKDGLQHALIIAPSNNWGNEVVQAFVQRWTRLGGAVTEDFRYRPDENLSVGLRQALHFSEGSQNKNNSSRRQDFDMVFLLAYPSKAREIMPLLRYYYAGNVPVYGTSTVYSGSVDARKDKDLDGLRFCDIPFVFAADVGQKSWPEAYNSYNRLYALGLESYLLTQNINTLLIFPALVLHDKTGVVYLTPNHKVERVLVWAKFEQGVPHVLGAL
ncbi:MAG: penicillin-binding protein activator [Legionellaceae bacterium]|nr:penicillin-binding protein activator [Legionellaceae bacterium]